MMEMHLSRSDKCTHAVQHVLDVWARWPDRRDLSCIQLCDSIGCACLLCVVADVFRPPRGFSGLRCRYAWGVWYLPGSSAFHTNWTGIAELLGGASVSLGSFVSHDVPAWLLATTAACLCLLQVAVSRANNHVFATVRCQRQWHSMWRVQCSKSSGRPRGRGLPCVLPDVTHDASCEVTGVLLALPPTCTLICLAATMRCLQALHTSGAIHLVHP